MSLLKCTKPRGELVVIQPTALRQAGPGGVQEALCQYEATFPGAQSCAAETLQELEKSLYSTSMHIMHQHTLHLPLRIFAFHLPTIYFCRNYRRTTRHLTVA